MWYNKIMKKLLFLLSAFFILIFSPRGWTTELKGGVTYTVDSARSYLESGTPDGVDISDNYYKVQAQNVEKMVTSYNNAGEVVGVTVQYINEPMKAYIYKKGDLAYVETYDKPVNVYPHRGYRYNLGGELVSSSLTVSKKEMFRFDAKGKLIAHSVNGIIYDEKGNVIGNGK